MNKCQVEITETLQYREVIEAENEQKAFGLTKCKKFS